MKRILIFALTCAITTSVFAQTQDAGSKPKKTAARSGSSDIQELKDAIAAQQEQIKQLQQQISTRDTAIQQLQQQVGQANSTASQAQQTAQSALSGENKDATTMQSDFTSMQHDVADLKSGQANVVETLTETQKRIGDLEAPLSIHYKGISITPGGFLAGETVWRQRATLGDINTPFTGIPFSAAGQARQTEWYGSGRQSRLSFLMQGKWGTTNLTGYYEMDFLSAGVTSNNNQSNSYTMRQRQVWAQAAFHNGWTVTGGQMWSLVAETRKGLDPRTEANPMQIDAQYIVGYSWARQFGFRVTKNFNNKFWAGVSLENAQELLTVHGNPTNFLLGGPGTGGGLYNPTANYSSNVSPDVVGKVAYEPKAGQHYEVFVVGSIFRDRIYPNAPTNAVGAFNTTTPGVGIGANARWLVAQKKVELGLHFLGGNGVGRYGSSTLADLTTGGNGYMHPLRSYQGLVSTEYHLPKWDFYGYVGSEYVSQWWQIYNGKPVGYGSPLFTNAGCGTETVPTAANGYGPGGLANCTGDPRAMIEGSLGFWWKPYNGPKGRLQLGMQYAYITKGTWKGVAGEPEAVNNMIFTSFRYYLP